MFVGAIAAILALAGQGEPPAYSELTLRGDAIARQIEASLAGTRALIHTDSIDARVARRPGSYVQLGPALADRRFSFSVPDRIVDLGVAGKIYYQPNRIELLSLRASSAKGEFVFRAGFRAAEVALKGIHSMLGDAAVPDIDLDHMVLTVRLVPIATADGGVTYERARVAFSADVDNTFIPRFRIFDRTVDVMDTLTNYRRELCRSIGEAVEDALNRPERRAVLARKLKEGIAGQIIGPMSPIVGLRFRGTDLIVRFRR